MTKTLGRIALVVVGALVVGAAASSERHAPPVDPQRWEYMVLKGRSGEDTTTLNRIGRDGWELVAATAISINGNTSGIPGYLYFKRPTP